MIYKKIGRFFLYKNYLKLLDFEEVNRSIFTFVNCEFLLSSTILDCKLYLILGDIRFFYKVGR